MRTKTSLFLGLSLTAATLCVGAVLMAGTTTPTVAATPSTLSYAYDSLGRLISDTNSAGNSGAYSYDAAGNRTAASLN